MTKRNQYGQWKQTAERLQAGEARLKAALGDIGDGDVYDAAIKRLAAAQEPARKKADG